MKKTSILLALLVTSLFSFGQVYNHGTRVKITTVNELTTAGIDDRLMILDPITNEVKYVEVQNLPGVALDANVVHTTGDESITGQKTFTNSGLSTNVYSINQSIAQGILSENQSTGNGIHSNNQLTGDGIHSNNTSSGRGIYSNNQLTGIGIYSLNSLTGHGIVSNGAIGSTGFVYIGQNNGTDTFSVNKEGDVVGNSFESTTGSNTWAFKAFNGSNESGLMHNNFGATDLRLEDNTGLLGTYITGGGFGNSYFLNNVSIGTDTAGALLTVAGGASFEGNITNYNPTNDGNPFISLGASTAENLTIQALYDAGTQSLNTVDFISKTASATANKGAFNFYVDEALKMMVDDNGFSGNWEGLASTQFLRSDAVVHKTFGTFYLDDSVALGFGTTPRSFIYHTGATGNLFVELAIGDFIIYDGGPADTARMTLERTTGNLTIVGTVKTGGYTVATLPAGTIGMTAYVTDALAPTYLATVVGGGAVVTPVFYNGTNWICH